jgi:hypothetical protein
MVCGSNDTETRNIMEVIGGGVEERELCVCVCVQGMGRVRDYS